jgi:hypothetical protein
VHGTKAVYVPRYDFHVPIVALLSFFECVVYCAQLELETNMNTETRTVGDLPPVSSVAWEEARSLILNCRALQASGKGQGHPEYESALHALKMHNMDAGLLLGHIVAIEEEIKATPGN